jgi:tetratricopeptide (TPR) repeat protein
VLLLLIGSPGRAEPVQVSAYVEILDRYVDDQIGAVNALNRWTPVATQKVVAEFEDLLPRRGSAGKPPMTPKRAEAAVMLHTDLALALLSDQAARADTHLQLARSLLQRLTPLEPLEFRWRWYAVVTTLYWSQARIDLAQRTAEEGLMAMPTVGHFHVLLGSLATARAAIADANLRGLPSPNTAATQHAIESGLRTAAYEYGDALKIEPQDADSHLGLAWVHYLQRRDGDARVEIGLAREETHLSSQRYLADLIRAALDEREGQLDEAALAYDDAIADCPVCQSAYAGRVRVATNSGDTDTARLCAATYASVPKPNFDPWWDFFIGGLDQNSIAWLRDEVRR